MVRTGDVVDRAKWRISPLPPLSLKTDAPA